MFETPVLLLIFNRADTTKKILTVLEQIRPKQLFVAADGPRDGKEGEYEKCLQAREIIDSYITWPCEIHKLYREHNLGCGVAVSSSVDWFFSKVDKGIILEDDTLPDTSFFYYCEKLLNYYDKNDNVMHIAGSNLQCGIKRTNYSYYFSKYPLIWGWATWKNSWLKYSYDILDSDSDILSNLKKNLGNDEAVYFYEHIKNVKYKKIDTWDFQWLYAVIKNSGLCIVPSYNLVKNLGFNNSATHTTAPPFWYRYLKNKPLTSLDFNPNLTLNHKADKFYMSLTKEEKSMSLQYAKFLYNFDKIVNKFF